jgi:tetratricopeptide (TPR) repeat protein
VQATFGGSWRLLAPREQHSLARLAVFAGPFSRAAANEVAGASLPLLAALFDKSLIQAAPEGRFSLHPLVRQYARARLDPSAAAEAHGRLLAYFASELARDGGRRADATADAGIGHDLPNIVAAWAVAVGRADAAALRDMTLPLLRWFERTGRWQELGALVDAALAALDQTEAAHGTAFARLLRSKAAVLGRQGRLDDALDAARHALRLARRLRDRAAVRANLGTIGNCLVLLGRRAQARHCFELALAQARADRDVADIASNTNNLATIEKQVGRYDRALPLYRESLALKRELGEMRGVAVALHNIGNLYRALQQWADAVPFLEEGLAVCEAHGLSSVRPSLLANLGATRLQLGQVEGATRLLERALAAVRESGERHIEAFTRLTLIKVALAAGDVPRARQDLAEALRVAQAMGSSPYLLEGLMAYAMVLEHEGERERAAAYCLFVAGHDAVNEADRVGTLQQLEALRLGPSQRQRAADAARAMPALDHAVAAVLHEASGDATAAAVTA